VEGPQQLVDLTHSLRAIFIGRTHAGTSSGQLFLDPVQDGRDEWVLERGVHSKVMCHVVDLEIASVSRMDVVDDLHNGFAVCPAHDVVASAADDKYGSVDALPDLAEVQASRTKVFPIRGAGQGPGQGSSLSLGPEHRTR